METNDLIELIEEAKSDELIKSASLTALLMIKEGYEAPDGLDDMDCLIRFFLEEIKDPEIGKCLCEKVTVGDFSDGYNDAKIFLLAGYADNREWLKDVLLSASPDLLAPHDYLSYARALRKAGAHEDARSTTRELLSRFDELGLSADEYYEIEEFEYDEF